MSKVRHPGSMSMWVGIAAQPHSGKHPTPLSFLAGRPPTVPPPPTFPAWFHPRTLTVGYGQTTDGFCEVLEAPDEAKLVNEGDCPDVQSGPVHVGRPGAAGLKALRNEGTTDIGDQINKKILGITLWAAFGLVQP